MTFQKGHSHKRRLDKVKSKNKMKKIVSVCLAITLLACCIPTVGVQNAKAETENNWYQNMELTMQQTKSMVKAGSLVTNGGFETGDFTGWNNTDSTTASIVSDKKSEGSYSVKMVCNGNNQAYIESQQMPVESGETYIVSYKLFIEDISKDGNDAQCYALINEFNNSGTASSRLIDGSGRWFSTGDWEEVSFEYTVSDSTKYIRLDLFHNAVKGTSYWDDIKIEKKQADEDDDPNNILANGNFSYGISSWMNESSGGTKVTFEGDSKYMVMTVPQNGQGYVDQTVNVKGNHIYEISYKLKMNVTAEEGVQYGCIPIIQEFSSKGAVKSYANVDVAKASTNGWETVSYEFKTKSDTTQIRLDLMHANLVGTSYWDDIKIIDLGEAPAETILDNKYNHGGDKYTKNSKNEIGNSTFDGGDDSFWELKNGINVYKTKNNGGVIKLTAKGGRYFQTEKVMELQQNKVYTFSYWIRVEEAKDLHFSAYYIQYPGEAGKEVYKDYVTPYAAEKNTNGWVNIKQTIITPSAEDGKTTVPYTFGFKTYHTYKCAWQKGGECDCNSKGNVYIDDIAVVAEKDYVEPVLNKKYNHGGDKNTKSKKNLISNSCFDNGKSAGWIENDNAIIYKTNDKGGVLKFNAGQNTYVQSDTYMELEPETVYQLTYWVYVEDAKNLSFTAYITGAGIEWKDFLPFDVTGNTKGWKKITNTFSTPKVAKGQETAPLTLGFKSHYNSKATIYIDDIAIVSTGKFEDVGDGKVSKKSIIMNGTFDRYAASSASVDYWNLNTTWTENKSKATLQKKVSRNGQAVKIDAKGHFYIWANDFSVKPGSVYVISYWVKVENANGLKFAGYMNDANNQGTWWVNDATAPVYGNTNGWKKVSSAITIPESVGNNKNNPGNFVQLGLQVYEGSGTIYIDDVSMILTKVDAANSNLDFELDNKILYNWSLESYNGGNGTVEASSVVRDGATGKVSALIKNEGKGGSGETIFISRQQKVEPNTTYEISYWIKQEGNSSALTSLAFRQTKSDQTTEALSKKWNGNTMQFEDNAVLSPYWSYSTRGEAKWQHQSMPITTGSETNYIDIRFIVMGENISTYIDDVTIRKVTKNVNFDMEYTSSTTGAPENWYMAMQGNEAPEFRTDSKVYHSGTKSMYIKKDSLIERTNVDSAVFFKVDSKNTYQFSAWVSARNASPDCTLKMMLYLYDENGNRLYNSDGNYKAITGTTIALNSDDTIGDWKQTLTRSAPPSEAAYASVSFIITRGSAEIWIDDIFCDVVENETDCVVEYSDLHAKDQNGNISGWELETLSGKSKFDKAKTGATLKINSGESYIKYKVNSFTTDYTYTLKGTYESTADENIQVRFYDYKGNEYTDSRVEIPIKSTSKQFETTFVSPSTTRAYIYVGGKNKGQINLKTMTVYMVAEAEGSADWDGEWVWYPENPVKEAVEQYRYFRYTFELDDDASYAPLQFTVDDKYAVYVNGELLAENWDAGSDSWGNVASFDLTEKVHKGKNVIAIKAYNLVSEAGVLFDGKFTLKNQSQVVVASGKEVVSSKKADDKKLDWTKVEYDDSAWIGTTSYGKPPCSPWGPVFYNTSLYVNNMATVIKTDVPKKVTTGEKLEFTLTLKLDEKMESNFNPMVTIYKRNSLTTITKTPMTFEDNTNPKEWPVGEEFEVKCSVSIPDYVDTGMYTLQMEETTCILQGNDITDNKFLSFKAVNNHTGRDNIESKIENYNGTPTLMIDGEPRGAIFYLRPDLNVYLQTDAEASMYKSDLDLYITYGGSLYKGGCDEIWHEDGTIDYDVFDSTIYDTLGANNDALVMVHIGMFAPTWWLEKNPDERVLASNGDKLLKLDDASFSSEKFRKEAGEVLKKLIAHMKEQSYFNRVYGLKISGGHTYEWMTWGTGADQGPDYSKASQNGFKKYLKETYKTVEALRKAWGDDSVTFESATAPDWNEKQNNKTVYEGSIANGDYPRNIIDWNLYLNEASADTFLYYCQIAKEATDNKIIVGGYNGYLWTYNSYDANGKAHTAMDRVLDSEYVDWISSPISYNERLLGESDQYMAMIDTVQEHGKLYIAEQDNRTCLSSSYAGQSWDADWDFQVGQTRTLEDTIKQEKRDFANAMVNGNGQWLYDMYGGWLDDDQIYDYISDAKEEYDISVYMERDQRSDVAVFVGDETYAYMSTDTNTNNAYTLFEPMLMEQRKHLAAMGTGYDTYAMSSLLEGKVSAHKLNIVFSPFEVTEEMQEAVNKYLKTNNQYVVWVYLPGISDGKGWNIQNMETLTGFKIGLEEKKTSLQVKITNSGNPITEGIENLKYGSSAPDSTSPYTWIEDTSGATVLGYNMTNGKAGLAVKQMDNWTSIYSSAPCLDVELLRNLLKVSGCHIYSENNDDIIYANNHYVAVHSSEAGEKTITLPDNASVYDVFEEKFVSMDTDKFTFETDANDTHVFRLMTPNTYTVVTRLKSGKVELSSKGITEVKPGETYTLNIKPEDGYELESVLVNNEEVEVKDGILELKDINSNYTINVKAHKITSLVPVTVYVSKLIIMPWWLFILIVVLLCGGIFGTKKYIAIRKEESNKGGTK